MGKKHGAISDASTITTSALPAPPPVKDPVTLPPVIPKPHPSPDVPCKTPLPQTASKETKLEEKGDEEDMEVVEEKVAVSGDSASVLTTSLPATVAPSLPSYFEKQRAIVKPHILTHIIDGFVIQEGPEPFPVSFLLSKVVFVYNTPALPPPQNLLSVIYSHFDVHCLRFGGWLF